MAAHGECGYAAVAVDDGLGVLSIAGHDGASVLLLRRRAAIVEGYTESGTVDRFAIWSGDRELQADLRNVRDELRADNGADLRALAGPILRLLEPGRYGVREWTAHDHWAQYQGQRRSAYWYPGGAGVTFLIPTDDWPPRDARTIAAYAKSIANGSRPLAVTLRAEPPEDGDDNDKVAFLIDGHHKLAAYQRTGVSPRILDITRRRPHRAQRRLPPRDHRRRPRARAVHKGPDGLPRRQPQARRRYRLPRKSLPSHPAPSED